MIMLRRADGKRSVSSKYIKSMRITSDVDEVMLRIVAYVEGDAPVVLRQATLLRWRVRGRTSAGS